MIRPRSLASRLTLTALFWCLLVLMAGGILLSNIFARSVEQGFDGQLQVMMDNLLGSSDTNPASSTAEAPSLLDERFTRALSGWYWQLSGAAEGRPQQILHHSPSLFDSRLVLDKETDTPGDYWYRFKGPGGKALRVFVRTVSVSSPAGRLSFVIAGDRTPVDQQIATFNQTLLWSLVVLVAGLAIAVATQVHFGLRPLSRMRDELKDVSEGSSARLSDNYPAEISPLTQELNAVLSHNAEIVARARSQVSNLAHALKTPLTILRNESDQNSGSEWNLVREQAEQMQGQINRYLVLARVAGSTGAIGRNAVVKPVIDGLLKTLQILYRDKEIQVVVNVPEGVAFRGDVEDLEEMTGNLLDNSFKWATSLITVDCTVADESFTLTIGDDGPGLEAQAREDVLRPGVRLDESVPGSGLGLSIVADYARAYDSQLDLEASPQGGLAAILVLPRSR